MKKLIHEMRKIKDEMSDLRAALRQQLNILADHLKMVEQTISERIAYNTNIAQERNELQLKLNEALRQRDHFRDKARKKRRK